MYKLFPKNGKGATWYVKAPDIPAAGLVKAVSKDGFLTIVRVEKYTIVKW